MPEELGPDETQILAAMLGISEMVGGLNDLQELLGTVVRIVPQLVRADRCAIFSLDAKLRELRCEQAFGPDIEEVKFISGLVIKEDEIPKVKQKVIKQHLPALVRDAVKEEILPPQIIQRLRLKAMLIVPLVCRDHVLGIMLLDDSKGSRYFTSKEINVVMGIATMAGIAIDSTHSRTELATEKGRLDALAAATSDAFLVLDAQFKVRHINPKGEEMLGWKLEDIAGKKCSDVFLVTDSNGIRVCGSSCIGQRLMWGENVGREVHSVYFQRKDGRRLLCSVRGAAVRDIKGRVTEIIYAIVNVKPTVTPIPVKESSSVNGIDELKEIVLGSE